MALADRTVGKDDPPGVLKDWVQEFFATQGARYELRVQLQTDRTTMPVEDASSEWSEDESPYRAVATIELPRQESFSPARRVLRRGRHVLAALVRADRVPTARLAQSPASARLRRTWCVRHEKNAATEVDPRVLGDVPD